MRSSAFSLLLSPRSFHHVTPFQLEMGLVWFGDGVVDTHPHGGMHGQVHERVGGAPGCLLRFDPVRARLLGMLRCGGDGVEAQRQLLVNSAVGVEEDVGGVAVDRTCVCVWGL